MEPNGPLAPPPVWLLAAEGRVPFEAVSLLAHWPALRRRTYGQGETVVVIPGIGATDGYTVLLRRFLGDVGFRALGWGLGRNNGAVAKTLPPLFDRLEQLADESGGPLRIVGWSLGGYLAREAARERPDLVDRLVTLGSPVIGGPRYTAAARHYVARGYDLDEVERKVDERRAMGPIEVPITALYSRTDAVVAWRASLDRDSPDIEHVEVRCSHLGMVASREVFVIVAERLAG